MASLKIDYNDILYDLDGPALFIHRGEIANSLFLKVKDDDQGNNFICSSICELTEKALLNSEISIRGAISSSSCIRYITLDEDFNVVQNRQIFDEAYLDRTLPKTGLPLNRKAGVAPDALINPDAVFTIYLQGRRINRKRMRLSILRNNINGASNIIRTALLGADLASRRASSIDPIVEEPVFGSLMISVVSAHVNFEYISRLKDYAGFSLVDLNELMKLESNNFINDLLNVKNIEVGKDKSLQGLDAFDLIEPLLPKDDTVIEKVTFFVPGNEMRRVSFDVEDTRKILQQAAEATLTRKVIKGKIDQISLSPHTIRVKRPRGKLTLCQFSETEFESYRLDPKFKAGNFVQVSGYYEARERIDKLFDADLELISETKF